MKKLTLALAAAAALLSLSACEVLDAHSHFSRGLRYFERGQSERAIESLGEAIRLRPEHGRAHYYRGRALARRGQSELAIADFSEAIRLRPDRASQHLGRGMEHLRLMRLELALEDFDEAIRLDPGDYLAFHNRARVHYLRGELEPALESSGEAIRLSPSQWRRSNAVRLRGDIHMRAGNTDQALADFNEAVLLDPNFMSFRYSRGNAHLARGDAALAIEDFTFAIERRRGSEWERPFFGRGLARLEKGELEPAIADFREALRINPHLEGRERMAAAFAARGGKRLFGERPVGGGANGSGGANGGDIAGAGEDFAQALLLDPGNAEAHAGLGEIYLIQGAELLSQGRLRGWMDYFAVVRAEFAQASALFANAAERFDEAAQLAPDSALWPFLRGSANMRRGEARLADQSLMRINISDSQAGAYFDMAARDFSEALALSPNSAALYLSRGLARIDRAGPAGWGGRVSDEDLSLALADFTVAASLAQAGGAPAGAFDAGALGAITRGAIELAAGSGRAAAENVAAAAYVGLGRTRIIKWADPFADFAAALRLDPGYAAAHFYRGTAHRLMTYDNAAAIADFTAALRLDQTNALAYHMRGNTHSSMREFDLAEADWRAALQLDPNLSWER